MDDARPIFHFVRTSLYFTVRYLGHPSVPMPVNDIVLFRVYENRCLLIWAVHRLPRAEAVPQRILDLLGVTDLTREKIASRLQVSAARSVHTLPFRHDRRQRAKN